MQRISSLLLVCFSVFTVCLIVSCQKDSSDLASSLMNKCSSLYSGLKAGEYKSGYIENAYVCSSVGYLNQDGLSSILKKIYSVGDLDDADVTVEIEHSIGELIINIKRNPVMADFGFQLITFLEDQGLGFERLIFLKGIYLIFSDSGDKRLGVFELEKIATENSVGSYVLLRYAQHCQLSKRNKYLNQWESFGANPESLSAEAIQEYLLGHHLVIGDTKCLSKS